MHNPLHASGLVQDRWSWRGLASCHLLALALFASWLWPPGRQLWDSFDRHLFALLNAPLATSTSWAYLWGVASMRLADLVLGLLMLGFLLKGNWIFTGAQVRSALYAFLSVLFLLLLIRSILFSEVVRIMHWQHDGPSLVVDGAVRLSTLFPDWAEHWSMKDSSRRSFPGDHASVLLLWAMFLWPFASGRQRLLIGFLSVIVLLPRLVSGAHWGSDVFVGGMFLGLVSFGWGFYTPYAAKASTLLERLSAPVLQRLAKFPGLRRISLISG
ncbi:MAG: phosphatase PAP2 family protein [Burkholderiales bacterium]|nr:phosphatase PAP2 family protein [Burkholderiales bacterium]